MRRRDTCPDACHYLSTTGEDSRGLQGTGKGNELSCNPLPLFELPTKVAHRRYFPNTMDAGSIPAASTNLHHNASFCRMLGLLGKSEF